MEAAVISLTSSPEITTTWKPCNTRLRSVISATTSATAKGRRALCWASRARWRGRFARWGSLRRSGGATDPGTLSVTSDYVTLLANNMTYWNTQRQLPGQNPLGILYSYELDAVAYAPGQTATWQQNFAVQSVGHLSDIEPCRT